jgi:hypothetical protein
MTETQAISILASQKAKLTTLDENTCTPYQTQTTSYVIAIFGEESKEAEFMKNFIFIIVGARIDWDKQIKTSSVGLSYFIDGCIETVKNKGVYKRPKPNWLTHADNKWLIGISITLSIGLIGGGYAIGNVISNSKNSIIEYKYEHLKDSLNRLPVSPPLKVTNEIPSTDTAAGKRDDIKNKPHD